MTAVTIYTKSTCPFCIRAKGLLHELHINFKEISIDDNPSLREEMIDKSKRTTVPQIFIDDVSVGGCDDLFALHASGKLAEMVKHLL